MNIFFNIMPIFNNGDKFLNRDTFSVLNLWPPGDVDAVLNLYFHNISVIDLSISRLMHQ